MMCKDSGTRVDVRDIQIIMGAEAKVILELIIGALILDLNLNANEWIKLRILFTIKIYHCLI